MERLTPDDLAIDILGRCLLPSPVAGHLGARGVHFVGAADKVLLDDALSSLGGATANLAVQPAFERAGPRDKIFFDPRTLRCGVVSAYSAAVDVIRSAGIEAMAARSPEAASAQ